MFLRILMITAILVIVFKLIRGLARGPRRAPPVPEAEAEFPTDRRMRVSRLPLLLEAIRQDAREASFAVLFPTGGDTFNLQFSIIDGALGLDWLLINEINIRDRAKVRGLAQSYRYSMSRHRQNEVDFLRVTGGDLAALARLILKEIYSIGDEDELHLMVEGFECPDGVVQA